MGRAQWGALRLEAPPARPGGVGLRGKGRPQGYGEAVSATNGDGDDGGGGEPIESSSFPSPLGPLPPQEVLATTTPPPA